ncbi:hypothetical protein C5S29_16385 [ANME-1 cluster archaeon GoMg3.2]|nr:hypothetical protein [ANME-1 cluster archaeon GoMg3.2]
MSEDWKSDWETDRYLVEITKQGTKQPAAIISRLKKGTARGDMKRAGQITHPKSKAGITKEDFAKLIGTGIIVDSPILKEWFKNQEEK